MTGRQTPGEVWREMVRGNDRFVAGAPLHPRQDVERRAETATLQTPHAALFGCSDSRLAAEIIFDKGLGDLFVVRNAGQVISDSVIGSLEYAVAVLHVPLILGGNTDLALRRAAQLGDGWFASGTPAFSDAVRWRDQVVANRDALGIGGAFPIYVRVPEIDPDVIERYEREGFDHVMVWADQVWPADADPATKRAALGAAAERLGVHPHAPVEV